MPPTDRHLVPLIGPFDVGEIPPQPVAVQAVNAGAAFALTGYTVSGTLHRHGDDVANDVTRAGALATTDLTDDTMTWSIATGDLDTTGTYTLTLTATKTVGGQKVIQRLRFQVQ